MAKSKVKSLEEVVGSYLRPVLERMGGLEDTLQAQGLAVARMRQEQAAPVHRDVASSGRQLMGTTEARSSAAERARRLLSDDKDYQSPSACLPFTAERVTRMQKALDGALWPHDSGALEEPLMLALAMLTRAEKREERIERLLRFLVERVAEGG